MNPFSDDPSARLYPRGAFDVVVIAASAGGIQAIRTILNALPPAFPAALIFQMHLNPTYPSVLVDILQRSSSLPIDWAADNGTLYPGTVTIAPPGQHVEVYSEGRLSLTSWA